jgi:hypothetical protein
LSTLQILGTILAIASVALLATSFIRRKPGSAFQKQIEDFLIRYQRNVKRRATRESRESRRWGRAEGARAAEEESFDNGGSFEDLENEHLIIDFTHRLALRLERIEMNITWLMRGMGMLFGFAAAIAFKA